jgi:hypothetical protein
MAGELIAPGAATRGTAMTPMEQPERPRQEGNPPSRNPTPRASSDDDRLGGEARSARDRQAQIETAGREGFADGGERDHTARQRTSAAQRSRTVARG